MPHDASIAENEQIHIWNIHNGERFVTNATTGQRGSGIVSANGPAAHCACAGDLIVIVAFAQVHEDQAATHQPQLVFADEHPRQTELRHAVPTQAHPRRLTMQTTRNAPVSRSQASVWHPCTHMNRNRHAAQPRAASHWQAGWPTAWIWRWRRWKTTSPTCVHG